MEHAVLHLTPGGRVEVHPLTEGFSFRGDAFREGQLLSVFRYRHTWTYRERHPDGDEIAVTLEGEVEVLLDRGDGEIATRVEAGSVCVIPAGVWHRLRVGSPTTVLFVTPAPARTEHEDL
jgi:mannose-6-phosphate isomerase-like protein (cupin superfamily)